MYIYYINLNINYGSVHQTTIYQCLFYKTKYMAMVDEQKNKNI